MGGNTLLFVCCLETAVRAPASPFVLPPLLLRRAAGLALLTSALLPLASQAQGVSPRPGLADASHPGAPTTPLAHPPMASPMAQADPTPPMDWRQANESVAAFPRGHADILAWEARQRAAPPSDPAHQGHGSHPHSHSMGSGGQP